LTTGCLFVLNKILQEGLTVLIHSPEAAEFEPLFLTWMAEKKL